MASFDLLFKKPFRLNRWAEMMIGLGPEVVRSFGADKATSFGVEVAIDFMFWPSQRFGFWVEPATDVVFRNGASQGLGCTAGLLLGW